MSTAQNARCPTDFGPSADQRRRSIVAGAAGNFVEFYDWTIYAYMAPIFASQIFPGSDPAVSLLLAFSTFALGYIARPAGALLFGSVGDRVGRRHAMMLAILGMGLCSLVIGLTPVYASIGIAAAIIFVLARLLQGLSAGGEAGSAAAYLVEFAHPDRRALSGSLQHISTGLGTLSALAMSSLVTSRILPADMAAWGWRVPFLIGAALSLVGLYLRLRADETPVFRADAVASGTKMLASLMASWQPMILVSAIALLPGIAFLTWQIYLPTYISATTAMPRAEALNISLIGVVVFLVLIPITAMLADRIGRRPLMIFYAAATLVWAYPTYVGIPTFASSPTGILTVTIVGNIILSVMAGGLVACMAEQFETMVRATGNGLAYAIGVVVSGAAFPPVATALMERGHYLNIALFVMAIALISLAACVIMPETRDRKLSRSGTI